MKRYLITITGRANFGCKGNKLRDRDLCCSYVYGKNKAEAISKFWEQIEKSSGLKGFERRDFKITAERWEKDSFLDVNGNVVTDIEWAIPFDLLASVEMVHDEHFKNYKLAVPESIMAQAEADQAQETETQEENSMKNSIKASEIIRESWDWHGKKTQEFIINGKKIKTNLCSADSYWNGNDVPAKYSHELGGTNHPCNKSMNEELDDCIAQGFDEIRFMLLASGMIRGYCKIYVWASNSEKAKEIRAKERTKREAEKLEQAKAELQSNLSAHLKALDDQRKEWKERAEAEIKAQESKSEAQKANSWHVSVFFSKNQIVDELQKLKDDLGSGDVVGCTKIHEHQRNRFIKALDVALFLINATDELPEPSQESSSDNSKEIIKETD